ncbi:hypothetical protein [Bacteroides graminisolvens]
MTQKKESFFWTSYSDLMTSLFFIMLVLFVLVIVLLNKRMEATEKQLEEIRKVERSTQGLSKNYFKYRPEYKKYVLNIEVSYPVGESEISMIDVPNKEKCLIDLYNAGKEVKSFLERNHENKYILIIEGQASKDSYLYNYELSYQRALGLIKYWIKDKKLDFGDNCEIQIAGSGDGKLDTNSMRENLESANQRFLIHILPKNIMDGNDDKKAHL